MRRPPGKPAPAHCDARVYHDGGHVAMIVAETYENAREAAHRFPRPLSSRADHRDHGSAWNGDPRRTEGEPEAS